MAGSNPGKSQGKKSSKQRGRLGPDGLWLSMWFTPAHDGLAHLVDGKITEQVLSKQLGGGPGSGGRWSTPMVESGRGYTAAA